jgi:hypothetical protein
MIRRGWMRLYVTILYDFAVLDKTYDWMRFLEGMSASG